VFHHNQGDLAGLAALTRHMARLVEEPERAEPLEQYGLSRLLERGGDRARARRVYEMAIEAGLPHVLGLAARRRLARLARRDGEHGVAHSLWQELAAESENEDFTDEPAERKQTLEAILEACEQLAIHYEHRDRDREEAIRWTRHAVELLRDAAGIERKFRERWNIRLRRRIERLSRTQNPTSLKLSV